MSRRLLLAVCLGAFTLAAAGSASAMTMTTLNTCAGASPPLGATLVILGREATLARIARCLRETGGAR